MDIQKGSGAKSYTREGVLIYKEMREILVILYVRRLLDIYMFLRPTPSKFPFIF